MKRKGANQITNLGGETLPSVQTVGSDVVAVLLNNEEKWRKIDVDKLSPTERSMLVYAESCCVDYGGLMESIRMNQDDFVAIKKFKDLGLLDAGRVPGAMLRDSKTHWVILHEGGWALAHQLRRKRADPDRRGPFSKSVFAELKERGTIK